MPYIPFYNLCPAVAELETRVIHVIKDGDEFGLPVGEYVFIELFCDECDCRRVFLQVLSNQRIVAVISFGWEKLSFYRKAFEGFDEKDIKEIKGPVLDLFNYQSNIADGVFKMFKKILFTDKVYIDRIKRHYIQFKKELNAKTS